MGWSAGPWPERATLRGRLPAMRAFFGGQAALALAEAGLADDARVKIAEQVERWPDDVQARMLAGSPR
jgi:hypothetical protein